MNERDEFNQLFKYAAALPKAKLFKFAREFPLQEWIRQIRLEPSLQLVQIVPVLQESTLTSQDIIAIEYGKKFKGGRKPGAIGNLKKLVRIEFLNALDKGMTVKEITAKWLWQQCQNSLEARRQGIEFYEDHIWAGKVIAKRTFENHLSKIKVKYRACGAGPDP